MGNLVIWLLVIGYWLLVIGYWLLVIGYWLLVIGYWLLGNSFLRKRVLNTQFYLVTNLPVTNNQ
ncbi:hypothetical protein GCM10011514_01630 [Emticicia aquatilis]|uniref:Uncharacterized protein n=1 Tax=Emticicia aquatilis TaxID=1537369 RepID=A0A916YDR1_9BACT|nr:hypothetical protein GCM10011514_01630 [Emticicia aquatilis]